MKLTTDTDVVAWFIEAELTEGERQEWFFVDEQSMLSFLRDWLRERAEDCLEGDAMKEVMRMIDFGALQHASSELETQLMESHDWGSFKLQSYEPDTVTVMRDSVNK